MSDTPFLRPLTPLEPRDLVLGVTPAVAGFAVGVATNARGRRWYRRLEKPSWTPPDAVFGPVWTTLYALMGAAAVIVSRAGRTGLPDRPDLPRRADSALMLFAVQLALNLLWSILFFGARRIRPAAVELVVLWVSIVATTVAFLRVRLLAGMLLLPYLAWTTFAAVLNAGVIRRNPRR